MFAGYQAQKLLAAFRASQKIPDAWDAWRSYRAQVTENIIENSIPGTSLAIFGAGRLNDLSLQKLLGHFSQVALFDIDEAAMREGIWRDVGEFLSKEKIPCGISCKKTGMPAALNMFPVDFVGIADGDYIAFADVMLEIAESLYFYAFAATEKKDGKPSWPDRDAAAILARMYQKAQDELFRMYEKSRAHIPELPQETYDYTVALGVHSQLGNVPAWLLDAVEAYLRTKEGFWCGDNQGICGSFWEQGWRDMKEKLLVCMERESTFLSERLNEIILSATKRKAFIGCEVSRALCGDGIWYAVPDSYVSGAWQAAEDVKRRAARGSISFENYLDIIWPFSLAEEKAYRMMVMEIEVG